MVYCYFVTLKGKTSLPFSKHNKKNRILSRELLVILWTISINKKKENIVFSPKKTWKNKEEVNLIKL